MGKDSSRIATKVDTSLLQKMQAGVAGRAPEPEKPLAVAPEAPASETPRAEQPSPPARARRAEEAASRNESSRRTTLSVPKHVGEHVRRLTMALTLAEGLESSIGETISRALHLLEGDLKAKGASVPEDNVRLRSGPRHL